MKVSNENEDINRVLLVLSLFGPVSHGGGAENIFFLCSGVLYCMACGTTDCSVFCSVHFKMQIDGCLNPRIDRMAESEKQESLSQDVALRDWLLSS